MSDKPLTTEEFWDLARTDPILGPLIIQMELGRTYTEAEVNTLVQIAYNDGFNAGRRGQAQAEHAKAIVNNEPAAVFGAAVAQDLRDQGKSCP